MRELDDSMSIAMGVIGLVAQLTREKDMVECYNIKYTLGYLKTRFTIGEFKWLN